MARKDDLEEERQELIGLTQVLDDEIRAVSGERREELCRFQDEVDARIDEIAAEIGPEPKKYLYFQGEVIWESYESPEAFFEAIHSRKSRSAE